MFSSVVDSDVGLPAPLILALALALHEHGEHCRPRPLPHGRGRGRASVYIRPFAQHPIVTARSRAVEGTRALLRAVVAAWLYSIPGASRFVALIAEGNHSIDTFFLIFILRSFVDRYDFVNVCRFFVVFVCC